MKDRTFVKVLGILLSLFGFFVSLELMGGSFKLMGKGVAESLIATTENPFVGLFIGILATSLVQSSSTVTSMAVSLVASGGLTIAGAIPIVMGANIGTSVTNTIVSLAHVTRKEEFRLALGGATVHDFFNIMVILVLFPFELITKFLSSSAKTLASGFEGVGGAKLLSPLKEITKPVSEAIIDLTGSNGWISLAIGVLILFLSLRYLVVFLKALVLGRSEQFFHKYIFGPAPVALAFGAIITIMVQSSSITTSLTVPLVAAGIVTVSQIFPFVLGANIGTTITALLAAMALSVDGGSLGIAALEVAFVHVLFNVLGVLMILPFPPIRQIPIKMAEGLGNLAYKSRGYAIAYVVTVFFIVPLLVIAGTRGMDTSTLYKLDEDSVDSVEVEQAVPAPVEEQAVDSTTVSG